MKRLFSVVLVLCMLLTSASALTTEQITELLQEYYIDEIPEHILEMDSIEEILQALGDPYTMYYDQEEYAAFLETLEDIELVGIGIKVQYLEEGILVNETAPDSPAREVGLLPGDYIIALDGHDTRGAADEDIESWIRGVEGSRVRLTVLRGEEIFSVTATRRHVVFPVVKLVGIENGVGWISCSAFGPTTCQHFYDIITTYDDQVEQWVVDLRGNTGGEAYSAVYSAGLFAGTGSGIYMRNGAGEYRRFLYNMSDMFYEGYCQGDWSAFYSEGYLTDDPVYVLTDANTASASEMFCAMIRDSGAGLIVGNRTYGKGVVQTMLIGPHYGLDEGSAVKITTERLYSEAGTTTDKIGILPHFLVPAVVADEVTAVLTAPVTDEEDALILQGLSSTGRLTGELTLPLRLLCDPENTAATIWLLSAIPFTASLQLRQNGVCSAASLEDAAQACGLQITGYGFSDITESEFCNEIATLGIYGIVHGVGDSSYQPEKELTRAELCALLIKSVRFPVYAVTETVFADVAAHAWYAPYVETMYEMGFVQGYDGMFRPEETVSHEEFLTILGRMAQWLDMNYYELARRDGIYGATMPDETSLAEQYSGYAEWAREMVWLCDDQLLWAEAEDIDPAAATSREEAAAAVYNLLCASGALSQ